MKRISRFLNVPILLAFVFMAAFSGCAYFEKFLKPSKKTQRGKTHRTAPAKPKPKPVVDTQAQQRYYNRGLKHYAAENYQEAKKNWDLVIETGPKTALADKARVYLKKTNQVLKTLEEIENR